MENDLALIADFISKNQQLLSTHIRQKLISAGAKSYVDDLGASGIRELERESAGLLLDLACVLMRRFKPDKKWQTEAILVQLPEELQKSIKLPRSAAYNSVLAELDKIKAVQTPPKD